MNRQIAGVFDRAALEYDRIAPRFFAHFGRRLVELAQISAGADILDVATGTGAILQALAQPDGPTGRALGVDLSAGMLHRAIAGVRQCWPGRIHLFQMDANQLAFVDQAFDFVLCGHSIFFFPVAVGEFQRVLKTGGKVGISIIAAGCFDWLFDLLPSTEALDDIKVDKDLPPIDTVSGLTCILERAGFRDVYVIAEETELVYANEGQWWTWLWTLGFRGTLENMERGDLEALREKLFQRLQEYKKYEGFYIPFRVLFAFGLK